MWYIYIHIHTTGRLSVNVLSLASEFMLNLLSSVVENMKEFERKIDVLNLNTRHSYGMTFPCQILTSVNRYQVIQ